MQIQQERWSVAVRLRVLPTVLPPAARLPAASLLGVAIFLFGPSLRFGRWIWDKASWVNCERLCVFEKSKWGKRGRFERRR